MDIGLDEQKTHTEKKITLCELVKMKINIPFLKQPSIYQLSLLMEKSEPPFVRELTLKNSTNSFCRREEEVPFMNTIKFHRTFNFLKS